MALDETLNDRLRACLTGLPDVAEKRMMGGLILMVSGHMLGGARVHKTGERRFMFRVGKEREALALKDPAAVPVTMGTRPMPGFVHVDAEAVTDADLARWVALALENVASLPART